jgi:hypothetical protein
LWNKNPDEKYDLNHKMSAPIVVRQCSTNEEVESTQNNPSPLKGAEL